MHRLYLKSWNSFSSVIRTAGVVALGVLSLEFETQPPASAITLNMTYFNEGDPIPHDENPSWDPAGTILKAHFQAAKTIWEYLLPGGGSYDFDFEWDDDIGATTLGLTTLGPTTYIEINPNQLWFADPTPENNNEFSIPTQRLYSQLSGSDQATYFPGTAPPGPLEVNYQATGIANGTIIDGVPLNTLSASGQTFLDSMGINVSVDASNGRDLLSTILHEIGHVLGISGIEPGEYNIDPQHVGGLSNVLVLEGDGGHLGGGPMPPPNTNIIPGFLMCDSCGVAGLRRFATATDVLVIAEDQGIADVQLPRVERISTGTWSDTNGWIGGAVPSSDQDVFIRHGGSVSIDVNASAQSLLIAPGNSLFTLFNSGIDVRGTLTYNNATVEFISMGTLSANHFIGNPDNLISGAGSLVRFNQFTRGTSAATSATFGGSVAVGFDADPSPSTSLTLFNPNFLANWNIGQNLIIGDENDATVIIDNGTWDVNGNTTLGNVLTFLNGGRTGGVSLKNDGILDIAGNLDLRLGSVTLEGMAELRVGGSVFISRLSQITYRDDRPAPSRPNFLAGGRTEFVEGSPILIAGGNLTFEDTASANNATVTLEGGSGQNASGGLAVFKNNSSAATAEFRTKGGHFGPAFAGQIMGNGGQVRFEGTSGASTSTLINEGCQDSIPGNWQFGGTGGRTIFANNSSAEQATIHNHGASTPIGLLPTGGATHFFDFSTAGSANITNHADATFHNPGAEAKTVFYDSSDAGNATIENIGVAPGGSRPGQTEFRGNSSAALSNIHNRTHLTPGGVAGRTDFYDNATAADATIHTYEGYSDAGRIEFHDNSTAERARLIVENVPGIVGSSGNGGHIIFRDFSRANEAQIFLKANACCNGLQFFNNSSADDAQIITEDGSGNITFWNSSKAADPTTVDPTLISLGRGSVMSFYDQSKAEDAHITMAHGSQIQFNANSSANSATIVADGSNVYPVSGGRVLFNSSSLVNNSTVIANGGTSNLAAGATVEFINGAHAGNSTITANGPSNGGTGAQITFNSGAKGDTVRLISNAGSTIDFLDQNFYLPAGMSVGSIEGAGRYVLRGSHLIVGGRNLNTTVSGTITDNPVPTNPVYSGGRLTKVGSGTLTLAGTNSYSGLTTVNDGTLNITGSIPGGVVVNNGGTLGGSGIVSSNVTLNSGALLSPGASNGILTVGSLSMVSGSSLLMEIAGINPGFGYDRIHSSGALAFGGTLLVLLTEGFSPSVGQSFDLFNWGSITGTFSSLNLPAISGGLSWNTSQLYSTGTLSVGLAGDFDNDGDVDGRDFLVWQRNPSVGNLSDWQANYGLPLTGVTTAVPEPGFGLVWLVALGCWKAVRPPCRGGMNHAHTRLTSSGFSI